MDYSKEWNNKKWTQERIAFLPMRCQPPHRGHVNLALNASTRFKVVKLLLDSFSGDEDNPFPFSLRRKWLLSGLGRDTTSNIEILRGFDGKAAVGSNTHRDFKETLSDGEPFVTVTFNHSVLRSCMDAGDPIINPESLDELTELPTELKEELEGNGRKIRNGIQYWEKWPEEFAVNGVQPYEYSLWHLHHRRRKPWSTLRYN